MVHTDHVIQIINMVHTVHTVHMVRTVHVHMVLTSYSLHGLHMVHVVHSQRYNYAIFIYKKFMYKQLHIYKFFEGDRATYSLTPPPWYNCVVMKYSP